MLRLPVIGALILVLGLVATLAAPPARAASAFFKDTYFSAGYERQIDSRDLHGGSDRDDAELHRAERPRPEPANILK